MHVIDTLKTKPRRIFFFLIFFSKEPNIETKMERDNQRRIPPLRGAIKAKILKKIVEKVKEGASMASQAIKKAFTTIKKLITPSPPTSDS